QFRELEPLDVTEHEHRAVLRVDLVEHCVEGEERQPFLDGSCGTRGFGDLAVVREEQPTARASLAELARRDVDRDPDEKAPQRGGFTEGTEIAVETEEDVL